MMASSRGRDRSSPWDGRGFGRIGCLLHQAEEHAIMNRAETEDGSYASGRNRKLLAEWAAKTGENEYAEPALNPCQTTAYAFFTGDKLGRIERAHDAGGVAAARARHRALRGVLEAGLRHRAAASNALLKLALAGRHQAGVWRVVEAGRRRAGKRKRRKGDQKRGGEQGAGGQRHGNPHGRKRRR